MVPADGVPADVAADARPRLKPRARAVDAPPHTRMPTSPTVRTLVASVVGVAAVPSCIMPPKLDGDVVVGTSGVEIAGSDESPYTTGEGETSTTSWSPETSEAGDDEATSEGSPPPDVGVDTGTEDTGEPGQLPPGYPVDQMFGDDVRELDLVGHWVMPWNPAGRDHVEITIDAAGTFEWRERDADCSVVGSADGSLWVESGQLVLAVDAWDKPMPWDTAAAIGIEFAAPFRMRVGYTPMGGYLGFAAPPDLTSVLPWTGRAYARLDASVGPVGTWAGESELWATPPDANAPALIVRERRDAQVLSASTAHVAGTRTWWWPDGPSLDGDGDDVTATWLDETPGNVAGAAVIAELRHAYDGVGLITFTDETALALIAESPCP